MIGKLVALLISPLGNGLLVGGAGSALLLLLREARLPLCPYPDLGSSADRVWHAARLFRAEMGSRILLSSGEVATGDGSEAGAMRIFLVDLGVPVRSVMLELAIGGFLSLLGFRLSPCRPISRLLICFSRYCVPCLMLPPSRGVQRQ